MGAFLAWIIHIFLLARYEITISVRDKSKAETIRI